jgi:hypothetical protein
VLKDPTSLALAEAYIVECTTFYERGFGVSSHCFLHSLVQFYDLKLLMGFLIFCQVEDTSMWRCETHMIRLPISEIESPAIAAPRNVWL